MLNLLHCSLYHYSSEGLIQILIAGIICISIFSLKFYLRKDDMTNRDK